jgi:hypothetical protein
LNESRQLRGELTERMPYIFVKAFFLERKGKNMKIEVAIKKLSKGNKIKHKSWDSLIIETITEDNILMLSDDRGYIYYFSIEDFNERYKNFKTNWKIVSEKEYAAHTDPVKCAGRIKNFIPSNKKRKSLSEILEENVVFD